MADKPRVLVLGGIGFIGRHLVCHLVRNELASKVGVSDKVLPATAGLNEEEAAIYDSDVVTFKQANLARPDFVKKVFEHDGGKWDYVINLAAATKYSQPEAVYKENVIDVAEKCATAAAKYGCKCFIQVSTGQVYDGGKSSSKEDSKLKPWTGIAKACLAAEKKVAAVNGLKYIIARPGIVYGPGDTLGITPRIIAASTYKKKGKTMEFLWGKSLKLNTIHVTDCARALWFLAQKGKAGEVYNLVDQNQTDQGSVGKLLEGLYGINTGFMGGIKSNLATKVSMKMVADVANDKHLKPWSELCKEAGITDTPLTPYLDEELLYNNQLSLDGSKLEALGFKLERPKMTLDSLKEVVDDYVKKGFFPKGLIN